MRAGRFHWIAVKLTRACIPRPLYDAEPAPLTIDDERNPAMSWRAVDRPDDDLEDIAYARCWARDHGPVESLGSIQSPTTAPAARAVKSRP
jgi:hypothetical protein